MGELPPLEAILAKEGWKSLPVWTWRDAASYLDAKAKLADLPPRPLLHQGLKAKLTLILPAAGDNVSRLVLRVFKTPFVALDSDNRRPVYLLSLTAEKAKARFDLYAMPSTILLTAEQAAAALARITNDAGIAVVSTNSDPQKPMALLRSMN